MTNKEFSDEFDTLLNSFGVTPNIVLDEYEKSVFLTNAQEQLVLDIYNSKYGTLDQSFELTEEIRRYLSDLVETYETSEKITGKLGLSNDSVFFKIPDNTWFITYEMVSLKDVGLGCSDNTEASVVPMAQDELYRAKDNPFRGPNKGRVLRLDTKGNIVELISKYNIDKYTIRYLSRPVPIVLINLPDGLSINGVATESMCVLNPVIHRIILERAVLLAIISKTQLTGNKE